METQDHNRRPQGFVGRALLLSLSGFLLIGALTFLNLGQNLENSALDLYYRLRPTAPSPPELLLVAIDEDSFQEIRRPWPWPRRFHAQLINRLAAAGARLIIFDVLFAEPSNPEDDQALAQAMLQAGNVILACTIETSGTANFGRQTIIEPLDLLSLAAYGVAPFMADPDPDGVVRRFRVRTGGLDTMPALALKRLRPQAALDPKFSGLISYVGRPGSIETIPYHQLLNPARPLPGDKIKDRLVLVGRMLETPIDPLAKIDAFYTPFLEKGRLYMSGVEIQANILHTLLQSNWGRELSRQHGLILCVVSCLIFGFLCVRLTPLGGLTVLGGSLAGLWGAAGYLFLVKNFWIPPVLLSLGLASIYSGNVLDFFLKEMREKRWLRHAFGRYVSSAVVETIVEHPEQLELGGEDVEVTVMFADLADFTPISEKLAPKELVKLLEEYFETLTQIILEEKGTLDKFIGDAVMSFWGAPLALPDHPLRACRSALRIKEAMRELRKSQEARGLPQLKVRIGLNSGPVVAGNFGSRERFNYTVMGDTVNLAARLERANKHYGTEIILSSSTSLAAGDGFLLRELDRIRVKGRSQPEVIYTLLGPMPDDGPPDWWPLWSGALSAYRRREWEAAGSLFAGVLRKNPEDITAQLYIKRCRENHQNPPPLDWEGVHSLTSK